MKILIGTLLLATAFSGGLAACGDSGGSGGAGSGGNASTSTGSNNPAPPKLGAQIDRMGRPAVNTALDDTFLVSKSGKLGPSDDATRAASEDAYNQASDPTTWSKMSGTMELQLAVLDSLDGDCTNQLASCGKLTQADCYTTLAGVLAKDQLWVKTKYTSCASYLGVESDALGSTNADCGGRRPADDVIKVTYGALSGAAGFDDGITEPAGLHPTTFPYLAAAPK